MTWLDNGVVRLGADLDLGGAITWISRSGTNQNLVNDWDWGRQIQMSFYSGPIPFEPHGKKPSRHWDFIGWNPIQAGDCYGNQSKVLEWGNDGKSIHVKYVPMQWPLDNEPGECTYEWTISLQGRAAEVHARIDNHREDVTQYPARGQELPAVYVNGPWCRLITYTGTKPWTNSSVTELDTTKHSATFPWIFWNATESWAAFVDKDGFGLGLWHPECCRFIGGFAGPRGYGDSHDGQTGYMAAIPSEILDHNISYDYRFVLVLGTIPEIRAEIYKRAKPQPLPQYVFETDRRHWTYVQATDTGWPVRGELDIPLTGDHPQLVGPPGCWDADKGSVIHIEAAIVSPEKEARIFWTRSDDPVFSAAKSMAFTIIPDGQYHVYDVPVHGSSGYRGTITSLRFDPAVKGSPAGYLKLRSISVR